MLSNRVKRNAWLTFAIISAVSLIARTWQFIMHEEQWYDVLSCAVITALCFKFFLDYRKALNAGKMYGRI